MVDVKKLITGFLIVGSAAAGSGLIFALSGGQFGGGGAITPSAQNITVTGGTGTTGSGILPGPLTAGGGAFATQTAQAPAPALTTGVIPPLLQASDTNNLTDRLATAFVNGVIMANPNGATQDGSGNPALTSPDTQTIAASVASSSVVADLQTPNWDIEVASQPIKTANDTSSSTVTAYVDALNTIVNENFVATNLMDIVSSQSPDPTQVAFVTSKIKNALSDSLDLRTPTPYVAFQKSWVKMLVYQKNYLALLADANNDPVKTALLLQNESTAYNAAMQSFQKEMQSAQAKGLSFGVTGSGPVGAARNPAVALFDTVFGIKTAHAVFGVGDVISLVQFSWTEFANHLFDYAQSVALQILKNALTALIQRKVLTWIQGNGAPRFITNWASTLTSAYTQSALSAIDDYMNNNCAIFPGFAPQLQLQLGIFYKPDNPVCSNLLQSSLGSYNFQQFYQNFNNGGWLAYGASMLPSGNYYGGLAFAAQAVDQAAVNGQNVFTVKAQANQGLNGDEVCSDGSNPNGTHVVCTDNNGAQFHPNPDGTCDVGYFPEQVANGGKCANGFDPKVTTPGTFTNAVFGSAVDSSSKLVTAANSIVGLLNSLLGSLLNSLAQTAITAANNGVNSALNGGVSSISSNSIQAGGSVSDIPALALACSPSSQTASTSVSVILGASGGANDSQGNPPTYYWNSTTGASSTGYTYSESFPFPGTYYVTLTDSNDFASSTCQVIVQ